jgi:hypothetical protein
MTIHALDGGGAYCGARGGDVTRTIDLVTCAACDARMMRVVMRAGG